MALSENRMKAYRSRANCTLRAALVGNATLHVIELLEICGSHRQVYIVTLDLYIATEQEKQARGYIYCAILYLQFNPLNPELNAICYLLALLAHHFIHISRIRVKSLTLRLLMSCIYGAPILDVSRSHTTTQHSR